MLSRLLLLVLIILLAGLALTGFLLALPQAGQARPAAELHVCLSGCEYSSIQAAVDAANDGDVIKVAEGTYTGVQGRLAPEGYPGPALITQVVFITKTVTLAGGYTMTDWINVYPLTQSTTLDAQQQGRVLFVNGTISPTFQFLRITGGNANELGGIQGYTGNANAGGGAYISTTMVAMTDSWVFSNTAMGWGGGLFLRSDYASLSRNTIYGNAAPSDGQGGGLTLFSSCYYCSDPGPSYATLSENTIIDNAAHWRGGGLSIWSIEHLTLTGNNISGNTAASGGGLYLESGHGILMGNTFSANTAGSGGGAYAVFGNVTFNENSISGNTAVRGGGVLIDWSDATLKRNVVTDNTDGVYLFSSAVTLSGNAVISNAGTGVSLVRNWWSDAILTNNVIASNSGHGLYVFGALAQMRHTTIAHNGGSGAYVTEYHDLGPVWDGIVLSSVAMTNTALVGNATGITATALVVYVPITASGGITVTMANTTTLAATLWGTGSWANGIDTSGLGTIITSTHNYHGYPDFLNPAAGNYHLGPASAAIDAGIDAGVTVDLDGRPRPNGGGFDLGAYEFYQPRGLAPSWKSVTPPYAAAGDSVTYTLVVLNEGLTFPINMGLSDGIPAATSLIADSVMVSTGTLTVTPDVLTWAGTLLPDVPVTITYRVTVNESLPILNTALVTDELGLSTYLNTWLNAQYVYLPVMHSSGQSQVSSIVFSSDHDGQRETYGLNPDTLGQTRLTDNPATDDFPSWSPDRTQIAFMSNRAGNYEIYLMRANGSLPTNLSHHPATDLWPAWSPDGTHIAFVSERDGNREIYVMNADGTGQIRLTNNPADDRLPHWSPNGQQIVFDSNRDGNREIYVMNADGTGQTRLTNTPTDDQFPAWSPDGQRIVFDSMRDGNRELYVMNADGTTQTRLTFDPAEDGDPSWSVDGQRIVFASRRTGQWEIYVMQADGNGLQRLTFTAGNNWAPN